MVAAAPMIKGRAVGNGSKRRSCIPSARARNRASSTVKLTTDNKTRALIIFCVTKARDSSTKLIITRWELRG